MTPIRWALLVAPVVLLAACSGGTSHHAAASPSTARSGDRSVSPSASPPGTPAVTPTRNESPATIALPSTPPAPAPTTQIVPVSPVDSAGNLKSGYTILSTRTATNCSAGSDTGANAYRCFSRQFVYDPCWLDTDDGGNNTVACISQPWSTQVTRVSVSQFDGGFGSPVSQATLGVQLSDGERCIGVQGAHGSFNGRVIDFICEHRVLLRPLHTQGSLWLADSAIPAPGTIVANYTLGPTMSVTAAWVAAPSLTAPGSQ